MWFDAGVRRKMAHESATMAQQNEDPVVTNTRREALGVLIAWLIAMTFSVTYCYVYGYNRSAADLRFVLGFPDWFFWGLVLPWTACLVLSWWYAFSFMKDADLGDDRDEGFSLDGDEGGDGG
jgi:hypothetical protein